MAKTTSNTGKTNPLGQQIGVVKIVSGTVTATGADGVARILKVGDVVYLDDVIKTADLSFIQIAFNTGGHFELGRNSEAALDSSVLQGPLLAQGDTGQAPDVDAIQAAIQAGQDPTKITPPPAAGPGAGGPGGDDGHSFVVVNFNDQQGQINSGFNTSGLSFAAAAILEETTPLVTPPPGISVNDVTVNEGAGTASFTVTLDAPSANTVSVNFTTANGSATAGADYTASNGIVNFAPGVTSQTITVPITNDNVFEGTENFFVNLTAPVNGDIVDAQGVGTIIDNEAQPSLTINDVTVNESAGTATFTVTLSGPSASPVTVDFATANGTATSGLDYTGQTGSLSFAPGVVSQTITVPILNDAIVEGAETYTVNLTNVTGATIADNQGLGTIIDNDVPPPPPPGPGVPPTVTVNIVDTSLSDADTSSLVTFTFSEVPLGFTAADLSVTGGIISGLAQDLVGDPSGKTYTATFTASDGFSGTGSVSVIAGSYTDAALNTGSGGSDTVAIDTLPTISISNVPPSPGQIGTLEGTGGAPGHLGDLTPFTFTVTLSKASTQTITVNYATANGTAGAGPGGGPDFDYMAQSSPPSLPVSFAPGDTEEFITIQVRADDFPVGPNESFLENFFVNLLSVPTGNASIADGQGVGTIQNDDSINISDMTVDEAAGTATFTVSLSSALPHRVTVDFATADGTATAGSDYLAQTGTLTFAPGVTSQTITIPILNDAIFEGNETFTVNLSNASGDTIKDGIGVGTITDDDLPTADTVIVGPDYLPVNNGTPTFAPNDIEETITVNVRADNTPEPPLALETFIVDLTNPTNATTLPTDGTLFDGQGVGTIQNDDSINISDMTVDEAAGTATFTVSLSSALPHPVTVDFATADGTATAGSDYAAQTGTLTFASSVTSQTITISILNDAIFEGNGTFTVNLSNASGGTIKDGIGVGTIIDDDLSPVLDISDLLTGTGPNSGDLGEFLRFDTQTSPGNTLVSLDTDGADPALDVPLVTLTGMVVYDLSALNPTPDYTP